MKSDKIKAILTKKATDLIDYNQKREEELFLQEDIRSFLTEHALGREFLHENFQIFHRYALSLFTERPYALAYSEGTVFLEIAKEKISEEEKAAENRRKRIYYSDSPDEYDGLRLKDIEVNDDNKVIIYLLNKVLQGEAKSGYYLYGDFGIGKTYLCAALMNEFLEQGKTVSFAKVNNFVAAARRLVITDQEELNEYLDNLKFCDVLFLDDIGNEGVSSFTRDDILFAVLDYRMERKKLTFFTSNQDFVSLEHHYTFDKKQKEEKLKAGRLMERIVTLAKPYCLTGVNRRHS